MSKPCADCGKPKPAGRGVKYCDSCKERRLPVSVRAELVRQRSRPQYEQWAAEAPRRRTKPTAAPVGQSWCNMCKTFRPVRDFGRRKTKSGLSPYCKPCESNQRFAVHLARTYGGMTVEQYDFLLKRQGGVCAICGVRPRAKRLAVDHDHSTGRVRGLLCKRCNHDLLGAAHDSVHLLEQAIRYLNHPPARNAFSEALIGAVTKRRA